MRVYGYRTVCAQLINQEWLHIGLRPGRCSYVLVRNTRNTSRCKHLVTTRSLRGTGGRHDYVNRQFYCESSSPSSWYGY